MSDEVKSKKFDISPSVAILISGVLIAGAIIYVNLHPATPVAVADQPAAAASVNVPAPSANDHIIGSPSAPVVLVEYSDFQCPFCQMIYPTIKKIVDESNGQIAWVYREFPLESIHPQAKPAALAAECIAQQLGNDGFWKFADAIFSDQTKMSPTYYAQLAQQFGADPTKYASCIASQQTSDKIEASVTEAESNGGQGTPYTIVLAGGKQVPISGALPYAQIMSVINSLKTRQ
jgi:protein-disulfide isomerase